MKTLRALLINPYIYDCAAYNFWSSPLGLLYVGGILRENGFVTDLIDCMEVREEKRKEDGRAPFVKSRVAAPEALKTAGKRFRRYGISPQSLREKLAGLEAPPDLVLVTSIMTYWYKGAQEAIDIAREVFPASKIVAGGIFPTLCAELAEKCFGNADLIVRGSDMGPLYDFIEFSFSVNLPFKAGMDDLDVLPYPCHDLQRTIAFVPLMTSLGCAFKCAYCATPYMHSQVVRRSPASSFAEIRFWRERYGVKRFVIYDDSFLHKSATYAKPLLRAIVDAGLDIDFYNPNAVNAAFLDEETAGLLMAAGFREVRIGLESASPATQQNTGGKVSGKTFEKALDALSGAGFKKNDIYAYVLAGLPFQRWQEVQKTIDYVLSNGAVPYIAEYTPIPHTALFEKYHGSARYPLLEDAMYQNNALFPFAWEGFTEGNLVTLKGYVKKKTAEFFGKNPAGSGPT